ncbi:acrylyl-CoA reductase (NADPH) [Bordetella sp. 02P26C-1]|uniref:acrylyl-CoA reductase (NADPH) n=1 Tax=Bordetella sp. 02P26C-1 TaxID=2683195 RepID=UPI0013524D40|nr:MDR family oxidoreductase [Bordetella sp. 02P26C-1]MVW77822.1 acryloyl-CoA reductase [Bordetella sp. 02P26C-1]
MTFSALLLQRDEVTHAELTQVNHDQLPEGSVTVRVQFSTLNYKDALAITGKAPVVRQFPMVPGIDFAGVVAHSDDPEFAPGDAVLLNGWGLGESRWGGLAQYARVPAKWLQHVPEGLTTRRSMMLGTAGYTAMLCVHRLEALGLKPDTGPVLVTGANGGVGSTAIALLARRGYEVVASTGRVDSHARLQALGATRIVDRAQLSEPGKPLQKELWAGVVDSVGSHTLANACAAMRYGGVVAACGLAQGMDLPASVAPFILRGVTLAGVDSVYAPMAQRHVAWADLGASLPGEIIDTMAEEVPLDQAVRYAEPLLAGKLLHGRVLIKVEDQ